MDDRHSRDSAGIGDRHQQYSIAREYVTAGISVIPLRADGSKAPAIKSWNGYRERFATDAELWQWFSRPAGIGIVCGVQSGGLEVLDFDKHPDETFWAWAKQLSPNLFARLIVVETGGLGYHVMYRCHRVSKNHKIAMTADGSVLIESRGEGGYIVACGSAGGVHASGRPYVQVRGPALPDVPTITPEERKSLWVAAASLDERREPMAEFVAKRRRELQPIEPIDGSTPWGDFDLRADWREILEPAGWSTRDGEAWTRPGKHHGISAKLVVAEDGCRVLTVFSGNAGPLAPVAGRRSWGPFAAYAALHHGGDRGAAARAVRALGYGGRHHV